MYMRENNGLARRRKTLRRRLLIAAATSFIILIIVIIGTRGDAQEESSQHDISMPTSPLSDQTCRTFHRDAEEGDGEQRPALDSTVLMLFDREDPAGYTYEYNSNGGAASAAAAGSSGNRCARYFDEAYVRDNFDRVAASYLSSPFVSGSDGRASPYFDFFDAHRASFWVIDAVGDATPMTLDVVLTYVNPTAPSFRRHLEARGIPFYTERRYNDWEELRYSLRSLLGHVMNSTALRQDGRRRAADVATLRAMGYTVSDSHGADMAVKPLVERVYLVLSDADQVPAWLDMERFPQLRIVTHADMFRGDDLDDGILPTLNSNCIESGLHRIPGISRYFLYINNDHMMGRDVSFFDLFRPLSPLRQSLHVAAQQLKFSAAAKGISGGAAVHACADGPAASRRFTFFETLQHSESEIAVDNRRPSKKKNSAAQQLQLQCLNSERRQLWSAMRGGGGDVDKDGDVQKKKTGIMTHPDDRLVAASTRAGWKTTSTFRKHNPVSGPTARGLGVGQSYVHHVSSTYIDGFASPFRYAHMPVMLDRDVLYRMLEVVFRDLTRQTRLAYEREMHPFSMVDTVAPFTVAYRRDAMLQEWRAVLLSGKGDDHDHHYSAHPLRAELIQQLKERVAVKDIGKELFSSHLDISDLGPMYGNSWRPTLQAPDAMDELSLWWSPSARPSQGTLADYTSEKLMNLYAVPHIRRSGDGADGNTVVERLPESAGALYRDIFHHVYSDMFQEFTYRFDMVHSVEKTLLSTARIYKERRHTQMKPLWMCFNDNYSVDGKSAAYVEGLKTSFKVLMMVAVGEGVAAAPWEKVIA